jgi:putative membrane protein
MFLRLQPVVYVSALSLAALACKSSDTVPSSSPNAHRAATSESADESGVNSETSAPLPQASVTPPPAPSSGKPSSGKTDGKTSEPSEPSSKLDDAEIAAITAAANSAEVAQGRLAREKAKDPRVRDFGSMMVDHHGQAIQEQEKLSLQATQSEQSKRLQDDARDALDSLKGKRGKEFDRAYLQLQIDEHRRVLRTLNDQLLPAAKDSQLKAYLENLEPKVESHLAQAERLQEELNGTSSLDDSSRPSISNKSGSNARLSDRHPDR